MSERPERLVEQAFAVVERARKALAVGLPTTEAKNAPERSRWVADLERIVHQASIALSNQRAQLTASAAEGITQELGAEASLSSDAAAKTVSEAVRVYSDWSAKRLSEAEGELRAFEGLPVDFDILSLMGVDSSEAVFSQLLAWLLDPKGSHGGGDAFLRLFLARLGIAGQGRLFDHSMPLEAEVATEVSWDVPNEQTFRRIEDDDLDDEDNARTRRLRVDILLVLPGYLVPIELKVYAKESLYSFNDEVWAQSALYGRMWRLMLEADSSLARTPQVQMDTPAAWRRSLRRCMDANPGLRRRIHYFDGGRAAVAPVLIHPRRCCRAASQRIGERKHEHGLPVRHLRWLDIDRMLYRLCRDRDLQAGRLDLIRSFRTTLLRLATGIDLVERIEDLRLRMAEPTLTRLMPIQSTASLKAAFDALNEMDTCCEEGRTTSEGGIRG